MLESVLVIWSRIWSGKENIINLFIIKEEYFKYFKVSGVFILLFLWDFWFYIVMFFGWRGFER